MPKKTSPPLPKTLTWLKNPTPNPKTLTCRKKRRSRRSGRRTPRNRRFSNSLPRSNGPGSPPPNTPPASRKSAGKRKEPLTEKQRAAAQRKLALLEENLRPIPFSLDGEARGNLPRPRTLGLRPPRARPRDPLRSPRLPHCQLRPPNRGSNVNDVRISVSRSDLARALAHPVKKEKSKYLESNDSHHELFRRDESTAVMEDFMSRYMLFEDDMCILPPEVMVASQLVKKGMPNKMDWAGLMWVLVEKELLEAPRSGDCHYASHLQCLMKYQQPGWFGKEAEPEEEPIPVPESESSMEASMAEEEDDVGDGGETYG